MLSIGLPGEGDRP